MKIVNRIFYINVSRVEPSKVEQYMDEVKKSFQETPELEAIYKAKENGAWEDLFIPADYTKIEILEVNLD